MSIDLKRRSFLVGGLSFLGVMVTSRIADPLHPIMKLPALPKAVAPQAGLALPSKSLSLHNIHTLETMHVEYWKDGDYCKTAQGALNHILRDRRNDKLCEMNPQLFDMMHALARELNTTEPFEIICGYRSPETNTMLHKASSGVAKNSKHLTGDAIDLRLPGVKLATLRDAAKSLQMGGVGYYPKSNFVHIDIRDTPAYWS